MGKRKTTSSRIVRLCVSTLIIFILLSSVVWAEEQDKSRPDDVLYNTKLYDENAVIITEMMTKNTASVYNPERNGFPDWVEIYNNSDETISMSGWVISDKGIKKGKVLNGFAILPGEYQVIYLESAEAHLPEVFVEDFGIKADEIITLFDGTGNVVCQVQAGRCRDNASWAMDSNGEFRECLYPTPGLENTKANYDLLQEQDTRDSGVLINEVVVVDTDDLYPNINGEDWFELKNISNHTISLTGWHVTDDYKMPNKCKLPDTKIAPGEIIVVSCKDIGLALNADDEVMLISNKNGDLIDWVWLRNIPYGGSYGRMDGQNGYFYFANGSPGSENVDGKRRVSDAPVAKNPDGTIGESTYTVSLAADGVIYYTLDNKVPDLSSNVWSGDMTITEDCTVRAIAVEDNALPSYVKTFNYMLNCTNTIPVVCITSDDRAAFENMYYMANKNTKETGNIAFYEEDGSFSVPCEFRMHGDTSLQLRKKGMSVRFRPAYGEGRLYYDLFDGGVDSFTNLVLRVGQDQNSAMMRNEVASIIAMRASDHMVIARTRPVLVYINGKPFGIFHLAEKTNEQMYADLVGVDKKKVEMRDMMVKKDDMLYTEVFDYAQKHDMSVQENYDHIASLIDIDSIIDWVMIEGYFANTDLTFGNLRYVRATEGEDTRWKLVFYDLDGILSNERANHGILLHKNASQCAYLTYLFADLWKNEGFRDKFLSRAAELLDGELQVEKVIAVIDEMEQTLAPEVATDLAALHKTEKEWRGSVQSLRTFLTKQDWRQHNIDAIKKELKLSSEVIEQYFPDQKPVEKQDAAKDAAEIEPTQIVITTDKK